ncbi:hypothetical protein ACFLSJ_07100 [Verrucomicrobiota bacterium]
MKQTDRRTDPLREFIAAWFGLTPREQWAILLVLFLFLLGLAVRWCLRT